MSTSHTWHLPRRTLTIEPNRPLLMGIINVTPDSFSDGGQTFDPEQAMQRALQLVTDGADILDVGGESTRPFSDPVDADEECRRVLPVIEEIRRQVDVPISIDTSKAAVAQAAVECGAEIINDVTGLTGDPQMSEVARQTGAGLCVMHMLGTPATMQEAPHYENVVQEVFDYLKQRRDTLVDAGVEPAKLCLDPGIGFGKTEEHNVQLLQEIAKFQDLGCPILVGHSRKRFVGALSQDESKERIGGTVAVSLHLARHHVQVLRIHDVKHTRTALQMQNALGS